MLQSHVHRPPLILALAVAGCTSSLVGSQETDTAGTDDTTTTADTSATGGETSVDPTDPTTAADASTTEGETSSNPSDPTTTADSSSDPDSSSSESGIPDTCGDGVLDDGEQCDLGPNNSDNAACTSACQLAICGDGLLYIGREDCDDGNADNTDACLPSCVDAVCGDGIVWAGVETCDSEAAIANGSCDACILTCSDGYEDCDADAQSCEVELCGGTCDAPGGMPSGSADFGPTGAVDMFVVPPCVYAITIEAWGAQGGDNITLMDLGGRGARIRGDFDVVPGDTLSIIVGARGENATSGDAGNGAGGGGGGTFVWRSENGEPLLIAGGGGGSSLTNEGEPNFWGKDGVATEDGSGSRSDDVFGDAPGGTAGGDGKSVSGSGGNGWSTVLANPQGQPACNYGGNGGFGGGGGSGCGPNPCNELHTAGGGGGYSGGGAGGTCYWHGGGGGGSYNDGVNQDNATGVNQGDGAVTVSW